MPVSFMLTSNRGGGGGGGSRNETRGASNTSNFWPEGRGGGGSSNESRNEMRGESQNEMRGESRNEMRGESRNEMRGESRGFFARGGGYSPEETMRAAENTETHQLGFLRMHGGGSSGGSSGGKHHNKASQYEMLEQEMHRLAKELERLKSGKDDGLEEVVAGFEEIMPQLVADAAMVVENPPKTWEKYLKEEKFPDIIRMEGGEFMKALEKADNVEHFLKEATHTLAGIMLYCMSKN